MLPVKCNSFDHLHALNIIISLKSCKGNYFTKPTSLKSILRHCPSLETMMVLAVDQPSMYLLHKRMPGNGEKWIQVFKRKRPVTKSNETSLQFLANHNTEEPCDLIIHWHFHYTEETENCGLWTDKKTQTLPKLLQCKLTRSMLFSTVCVSFEVWLRLWTTSVCVAIFFCMTKTTWLEN